MTQAFRRGLDASRQIGEQLQIIEEDQLYLDRGYSSLNEYAQDYLKINRFGVARCLHVAQTLQLLEDNNLRLPKNETQVLEMQKLPAQQIPAFWQQQLDEQDRIERPLTGKAIREEVKKAKPRAGVKTPLDEPGGDNGETVKAEAATRIKLTEEGEAALERIRRHAGDELRKTPEGKELRAGDMYANAIEDMTVPITERNLIAWADEKPWMIKRLAFLLVDQRWTWAEAIKYEAEAISEQTSVAELLIMAKYSETPGELDTSFRDARIRVNIQK
jgi:hypothetical protein